MQNIDIIEIEDEQAYSAKLLASTMSTPQIRKRGMIDMLGISCAINYLHARKIRIDTKRSVYKIPLLFEEFKISDIYHGNYRIDVITLYKEKTIKIPKIHVDMEIMPHFYFVVQIGSKIKEAKMIGFIEAKSVLKCSHDSKYYYPTLDLLFDLNKFALLTRQSVPTKTLIGKHVDCMSLFLKFMDNDLSSVYKRQLIQHLMNCDSCRARFIDVMEFERLANSIRFYPDIIKKHETKTITQNVAVDFNQNSRYSSFEESINNATISEAQDENNAFINIEQDENYSEDNQEKTVQMFDIPLEKQSKKDVISNIFNELQKIEMPQQIKAVTNAKTKRALLITIVLLFVLGSFALISFKGTADIIDENNEIASFEEFEEDYPQDYSEPTGQAKLIPKNEDISTFTIQQPIPSKPTYSPTITKLSWDAPENLVQKGNYTKYLQLIGKNIKLNLQNDLLLVNDIPANKIVKTDIIIASNGSVNSIKITHSSGSPAIDASIEKIVNETLTYMKPPSHGIMSRAVNVTLTVELN